MRLGIFGGTFDPIHNGHLLLAETFREELRLDEVRFVPAAVPPHKQDDEITEGDKRVEMLKLSVAAHPSFRVDTSELSRGGVSYTVDSLRRLRQAALEVMRELSQFNPHLTGSVLSGSAGKYADIDIQLYTDSVKAVELYLIDRGIAYKTTQHRLYSGDELCAIPVFMLENRDVPIQIEVLSPRDLRRPVRRNPGGKVVERAKTQAVEALLAAD